MAYSEVPSKVLECFVEEQHGEGAWPYNDGSYDPYWRFGTTPRDYRWSLTLTIKPQHHSSHKTRVPKVYDGMDVKVGDYIASAVDGMAVKIIRIDTKTEDVLICLVEDVFRYNTFRDSSGSGLGLFNVPSTAIIFEVNDAGQPRIDPLPSSGVGPNFQANLISRFQTLEKENNFLLYKPAHGFVFGQLISVDPAVNSFALTDDQHPYIVGTVTYVNGPDHFTINPIQKVIDDIDHLIGQVGDVLYANSGAPGDIGLIGINPVLLKLRDYTPSALRGSILNATTTPGSVLNINGVNVTIGGSGGISDLVSAVNLLTSQHDITASSAPNRTIAETDPTAISAFYREVLLAIPNSGPMPQAQINGVTVTFTTYTSGMLRYGLKVATAEDIAADVNAATIPNLTAMWTDNALILREESGGDIIITNLVPDANGTNFAGVNSATGIRSPVYGAGGWYALLTAPDARAINVANVTGNPLEDFGLSSVENGVKAAAIYIEQGLRKSSSYVVTDISGRDALDGVIGDQAYVLNKGDGEWGLYLFTGGTWVMIGSAETAKTDSDTYTVDILSNSSAVVVLGEVSGGSKITNVAFEVISPFVNGLPNISIGDSGNTARLADNSCVDLTSSGTYVLTPSYVYPSGGDVTINVYWDAGGATSGQVKVSVSYQ